MMSAVVVGGAPPGSSPPGVWHSSGAPFDSLKRLIIWRAVCPQLLGGKVIDAGADIGLARSSSLELSRSRLSDQVVYPRRADPRIATLRDYKNFPGSWVFCVYG